MTDESLPQNGAAPLSTVGLKDDDQIVVYDPKSEGLKLATGAQAKVLAGQGYKIGAAAEYEAKKNDPVTQAGLFLARAGNMGSGGLLKGGLAALGRRDDLVNMDTAATANPGTAFAGDLAGIGASMLGGGLAGAVEGKVGGYLSSKLAGTAIAKVGQSAAGSGRLASLGKAALSSASQGALTAGVIGMTDQAAADIVMKNPVTVERLAHSAFTDIVWNAAFSAGAHGLIAIPKRLRSGTGDLIDGLEKSGLMTRKKVKAPEVEQVGPQVAGWTEKHKNVTRDVETAKSKSRVFDHELRDTKVRSDEFDKEIRKSGTVTQEDEYGRQLNETKTTVTTPSTKTEQAMAQDAVAREPIETGAVSEPKHYWDWEDQTPEEKKMILRTAINHHLKKMPGHSEMWRENANLEKEITRLQKLENPPKGTEEEIQRLIGEKEAAKELLSEAHPSQLEGDVKIPGFRELNDEYARVMGKMPASDAKLPGFGVEIPAVKGGKQAKPIKKAGPKTVETELNSNLAEGRANTVESDSVQTEKSTKVHNEERKLDDKLRDDVTENQRQRTDTNTVEHSVRWKPPKLPKKFVDGDYESIFGNGIPATIAVGGHMLGVDAITAPIAAGMGAANIFAKLSNHRKPIGETFDKYGTLIFKSMAYPTAAGSRAAYERGKGTALTNHDVSHYEAASNAINFASTNADAIHNHVVRTYPQMAKEHPETVAQITQTVLKAVQALDQQTPKIPFQPTLQAQKFTPPRAQQVKYLRAWQAIANPDSSLADADPQTMAMLKTVFPAWHQQATQELMHKVQTSKKPVRGRLARSISSFTGASVRAIDDAKTLKRLQETAGPAPKPEAGQPQNGNPKSTGGAKSAKITQAAVSADATSIQQREMGL